MKPRVRPCEPLCGLLRGGAASLCPGEGFRASFGRIFVDFPGSAEDEGRGRRKALALFCANAVRGSPQCGLPRGFAAF